MDENCPNVLDFWDRIDASIAEQFAPERLRRLALKILPTLDHIYRPQFCVLQETGDTTQPSSQPKREEASLSLEDAPASDDKQVTQNGGV